MLAGPGNKSTGSLVAPPGFHSLLLIKQLHSLPYPLLFGTPSWWDTRTQAVPITGEVFGNSSQALAGQEPSALVGPQPRKQLTSFSCSHWDCSERKHLRVLHCLNYKLFPAWIQKIHLSASSLFITGMYPSTSASGYLVHWPSGGRKAGEGKHQAGPIGEGGRRKH